MSLPIHAADGTGPDQQGFSLVETMVALCLLLVVAAGVLPLSVLAFRISENSGHLTSRAAEYAQDKLEQLMALSYGDTISDTRVFPAAGSGGSGLSPGGSGNPAAPVHLYVDYLSIDGVLLPAAQGTQPAGWYFQRLWRVEEIGDVDPACPVAVSPARRCLKRITVTATVRFAAQGGTGVMPLATVTALKTYPF